jgi:hypothetical protein
VEQQSDLRRKWAAAFTFAPPTVGWCEDAIVAPCPGALEKFYEDLTWCSIESFQIVDAGTTGAMVSDGRITIDIGKRN